MEKVVKIIGIIMVALGVVLMLIGVIKYVFLIGIGISFIINGVLVWASSFVIEAAKLYISKNKQQNTEIL